MNYDNFPELIKPEFNRKLDTFRNSNYYYNNKSKELVLDVVFSKSTDTNKPKHFNLVLPDPLIIDVEHDIFLDTVITYNLKSSKLPQNMAFLLHIDEFNIQTRSATNIKQITGRSDAPTGETDDNGVAITKDTRRTNYHNQIDRTILIPNEKSAETSIENRTIFTGSSIAASGGTATIVLPSTASGSALKDYYANQKIHIHFIDGSTERTLVGRITTNTNDTTPALTVSDLVDTSTDNLFEPVNPINNITGTVEIFVETNNHATIHKGRKHNYVGTITPTKLANINGYVSDMGRFRFVSDSDGTLSSSFNMVYGNPFHDSVDVSSETLNALTIERMIVEFKLVPRE